MNCLWRGRKVEWEKRKTPDPDSERVRRETSAMIIKIERGNCNTFELFYSGRETDRQKKKAHKKKHTHTHTYTHTHTHTHTHTQFQPTLLSTSYPPCTRAREEENETTSG